MHRLAARAIALAGLIVGPLVVHVQAAGIPRPEHPRPDAVRPHWANLNGAWQFRFDPKDEGIAGKWFEPGTTGFDRTITVPFPWESELSGIHELKGAKVGWYRRTFEVPADFPKDHRTWLRFEAVDWHADVWVNGKKVAEHDGGYAPFETDITDAITPGKPAVVVVRAFDPTDPELPTGKQVGWYTPTSGIWQTVWIESRPRNAIAGWTVRTEVNPASATFDVRTPEGASGLSVRVVPEGASFSSGPAQPDNGHAIIKATVPDAKLWTPETPHLYDVTLELREGDRVIDTVKTYFGLRTIARGKYGDEPYERLLLNGKPIYLRAALDQSFNPKGIYTAPDDDFLRRDLMIAKYHNLNGLRIHIKPDEPRRLYWADKLGLLILEDMPNTWRQSPTAREAWERTMREVVARDRNHPCIVTWVAFNETWGLGEPRRYKQDRDTQGWVKRMVGEIRKLDPTRLVEDNSPCNNDHVEGSDLNSWHFYIDDHEGAKRHIADVVADTKPGSSWNFCPGETQGTAPLINSEYGGIGAGAGDRDISWAFRDLTTLLRRQPKIQGYVYTELTDIEWEHNGFFDYDRTPKHFGYDEFLPDMHVNELQGDDFVGYDGPPAIVARPGETIAVPVFISHFSGRDYQPALRWWLDGYDDRADMVMASSPRSVPATWKPYDVTEQPTIRVKVPDRPFVGALNLTLRDPQNHRFAANFVNVVVRPEKPQPRAEVEPGGSHDAILRFAPDEFARQSWTRVGSPPAGKAYGHGKGFFEYRIKVPEAVVKAGPETIRLQFELAAKAERQGVDWPSTRNRQDYPQTDERKFPTAVDVSIDGKAVLHDELEDDPADARGVLSHLAGVEHGSYGYLVEAQVPVDGDLLAKLASGRPLTIRLSVPGPGGLCVFGAETGRYPFDPTVIIHTRDPMPPGLGVKPDASVAADVAASRVVALVASGDATRAKPSTWSYTTERPPAGWDAAGFDASAWKTGPGGFGTRGTPAVRVRTGWDSPTIWLRTTFEAPALGKDDVVRLHVFHDEDVEVRLNGAPIFEAKGYVNDYLDVALDDAARALLRPGKNVLAVSCRQTGGGQGVDVGLNLARAGE